MNTLPRHVSALVRLAFLAAVGFPAAAAAQVPTIDPGGAAAEDPADEPTGPGGTAADEGYGADDDDGAASEAGPPRGNQRGPSNDSDDAERAPVGYYHTDGVVGEGGDEGGEGAPGPVPGVHQVQRGDTLWDLCIQYYNSPWEWPKVWSYNPEITNPHWIYPGNQLRLRAGGATATAAAAPVAGGGDGGQRGAGPPGDPDAVVLRQLAYVDAQDLRFAGRIDGSPEEKTMLALHDEAYIAYPEGHPPAAGEHHSIYQKQRDVRDPRTGKVVGAYVRVIGELEIMSVKPGKRARAVVVDSVNAIERGDRVGPLRQRSTTITPTAASADVQARILEVLDSDQLIGARQVVVINKGKDDGVAVGNRLYAVRRGDAYALVMGPNSNIGKDDRRFPARALGELIVVDAGKHTSLAAVTVSVQELGVGDQVLLSRAVK